MRYTGPPNSTSRKRCTGSNALRLKCLGSRCSTPVRAPDWHSGSYSAAKKRASSTFSHKGERRSGSQVRAGALYSSHQR